MAQEQTLAGMALIVTTVKRTVILTAVAGVAAALFSLTLTNDYKGEAILLLAPLPVEQIDTVPGNVSLQESAPARVSFVRFRKSGTLDAPEYEKLFLSKDVAAQLRDKMVPLLQAEGEDVKDLLIEDVAKAMEIKTKILTQTANSVNYEQIIYLYFTCAKYPKVAAEIANAWAKICEDIAQDMTQKTTQGSSEYLKNLTDDVQTKLASAEKQLESLKSQADVPGMTRNLEALQTHAAELRVQRAENRARLAELEARSAQIAADIQSMPPVLTLRKSPPDAAYWLMTPAGEPSGKVLVSEEPNPAYTKLTEEKSAVAADLSGLKAQAAAQDGELEAIQTEIAELRTRLAEADRLQSEAKREVDSYGNQYMELSRTYTSAKMVEAQTPPDVKIAAPARVPEKKSGPHRSLIVLAAMFLAGITIPAHMMLTSSLKRLAAHL